MSDSTDPVVHHSAQWPTQAQWSQPLDPLPPPITPEDAKLQTAQAREAERMARTAIKNSYLDELAAWHEACRERKERHARAKQEHDERMRMSRMVYEQETSDAAPPQPRKPQV